ncbi:hypothetical protein B0H14DRAFT_3159825 [Mycena olivaceomarginata]|nr:hypothetical protein B0H14DRAFT_3159825 [Mycena olivaceomarginata]
MCKIRHLQSSALFLTLSLIPSSILLYLAVGLLSASLIIYALNHNCPSAKLNRLNNAITVVEGILTRAKAKCMHNYLALAETETRFLRTKLAVSKLHSRLLETRKMRGWKDYLHNMIAILGGLAMLECEVFIEVAHQRKLMQDIHESQEITDGAVHPQYPNCGAVCFGPRKGGGL